MAGTGKKLLVIDPIVEWDTYLGVAAGTDSIQDVHVLGGSIIVTGTTTATFWTTGNAFQSTNTNAPTRDIFLSFLDRSRPASQQLVYSTHIGGSNDDLVRALQVDSQGLVTLCGSTQSRDFPYTPTRAYTTAPSGQADGFILQFDRSQPNAIDQLVYGALIGGDGNIDEVRDIAVDGTVIHATSVTNSSNFPTTTGAFRGSQIGAEDIVVFSLDTSLPANSQLLYSTYLGSDDNDEPFAIALEPTTGDILVGGRTYDGSDPLNNPQSFDIVPGSFMTRNSTGAEGFLSRLNPGGQGVADLVYSTYIGGSQDDVVYDITVTPSGRIVLGGEAISVNFPDLHQLQGIYDPTGDGSVTTADGFILEIVPDVNAGSRFVQVPYWTYLAGSQDERVTRLVPYGEEGVLAIGVTTSTDYPTTNGAFAETAFGGSDLFLSVIHLDKTTMTPQGQLGYSTYLGGTGDDTQARLADDGRFLPVIACETNSNITTQTPTFQSSLAGLTDVYLAQMRVPRIEVTSPTIGTSWGLNSEQVIRWNRDTITRGGNTIDLTGGTVDIQISRDGAPFQTVLAGVPNTGEITWRVLCGTPATSANTRIRVASTLYPVFAHTTPAFEITGVRNNLVIQKAQLKQGNAAGRDSLSIQGLVDVGSLLALEPKSLTLRRPGIVRVESAARTVTYELQDLSMRGTKFSSAIETATGEQVSLQLDLKGRFKIRGKRLDLQGVSDPARLVVELDTEELGVLTSAQEMTDLPKAKFSLGKRGQLPTSGVFFLDKVKLKSMRQGGFKFDMRGIYWPPQGDPGCPSTIGAPPSVSVTIGNVTSLTLGSWAQQGNSWNGIFTDPNGDEISISIDPVKGRTLLRGEQSGLNITGDQLDLRLVIDGVPAEARMNLFQSGSQFRYP